MYIGESGRTTESRIKEYNKILTPQIHYMQDTLTLWNYKSKKQDWRTNIRRKIRNHKTKKEM